MRYLLICVLLLTGCSSLPDVVKELAQDPATACVTVTTIYGVARVYRTHSANTYVNCTPDGMTVKGAGAAETGAVQVPVRVPALELQIVPVE